LKTLSVKQPHATLICAGVKRVENRSWKTDYRGRLLIHASGDFQSFYDFKVLPEKWKKLFFDYLNNVSDVFSPPDGAPETIQAAFRLNRRIFEHYRQPLDSDSDMTWIKDAVKKYDFFFTAQAIIGEVTLSDIITDSDDDFAIAGQYHWIMADPVLYDKPITKVMGRLRLWDFQKSA